MGEQLASVPRPQREKGYGGYPDPGVVHRPQRQAGARLRYQPAVATSPNRKNGRGDGAIQLPRPGSRRRSNRLPSCGHTTLTMTVLVAFPARKVTLILLRGD